MEPVVPPARRAVSRRNRNRLARNDRLEMFWCRLDRWQRSYSFGVNWHPWELNEESWSERDSLDLFATIRSRTQRPYHHIEAHVLPTHASTEQFDRDIEGIGNVWTDRQKKGWLLCSAFVPADAFHSLCSAVARSEFAEVTIQVRNLQRGRGTTSEISLRAELTDLSDDG